MWVSKCLHPVISPSAPHNRVAVSLGGPGFRASHKPAHSPCGRDTLIPGGHCVCFWVLVIMFNHRNKQVHVFFVHLLVLGTFLNATFFLFLNAFFLLYSKNLRDYNNYNYHWVTASLLACDWCEPECDHFNKKSLSPIFSSVDFSSTSAWVNENYTAGAHVSFLFIPTS